MFINKLCSLKKQVHATSFKFNLWSDDTVLNEFPFEICLTEYCWSFLAEIKFMEPYKIKRFMPYGLFSHVQWIISKFWYGYRCENRLKSFHKLASCLVIVLCRLVWTDFLCSLKFFKEVSPNTCCLKRWPKTLYM